MSDTVGGYTYGDLDRALVTLGFERSAGDFYVAYREKQHDALILLPKREPAEVVLPHHYSTVRMTVSGRGVASEDALKRALREAASVPH